jgi:hypothetical protein
MIPKIRIVRGDLPQWIISSGRAAYQPSTHTIWLAWRGKPAQFCADFIHEMGHHLLEVCGFQPHAHMRYDEWWFDRFDRKAEK